MTKPKIENVLYNYLRGSINNILPLEFAIRAAESLYPDEFKNMRILNKDLEHFWYSKGITPEELVAEDFLDFSWDKLQTSVYLVRRHGRLYNIDLLNILGSGLREIEKKFMGQYVECLMPPLSYFRACDLISGNDIPLLIIEFGKSLKKSKLYDAESEVPLEDLPRVKLREPIHLHPSFEFCDEDSYFSRGKIGGCFNIQYQLSAEDFFIVMREFMYQYAVCCGVDFQRRNPYIRAIINNFLKKESDGIFDYEDVKRLDSFFVYLLGLRFWDYKKGDGFAEDLIVEIMMKDYKRSESSLKKCFNDAKFRINEYIDKFEKHDLIY